MEDLVIDPFCGNGTTEKDGSLGITTFGTQGEDIRGLETSSVPLALGAAGTAQKKTCLDSIVLAGLAGTEEIEGGVN